MKYLSLFFCLAAALSAVSCSDKKPQEKGFRVSSNPESPEKAKIDGLVRDSLEIDTRPGSVLLTGISNIRLTTIYKVNMDEKKRSTFIGSNNFHSRYDEMEEIRGNNWHNHLMPGFEAVYGYNMINIAFYDIKENIRKNLFEKPVLVRTLYYPTFSKDTLYHKPVNRKYFMVSAYDDDTNKDGFINAIDLRRFYLFDINGKKQKALIPENYSVSKSEYDPDHDLMYVFARLDSNSNGQQDQNEPTHIFWIDLKDPNRTGLVY